VSLLQHRGQDAAGITTMHDGHFFTRKNTGLVNEVFVGDKINWPNLLVIWV